MGRKGKEVKDHLGNTYCNTPAMCKAYGVPVGTFVSRRRKGITIEQSLVKDKYKDHLGNPYHNKKDMCDAYGVEHTVFTRRLEKGWSLEEALTLPWSWSKIRACKDHKGNVYSTRKAMCRAYGIHCNTFLFRIKKGMTLEQALTTAKHEMVRL